MNKIRKKWVIGKYEEPENSSSKAFVWNLATEKKLKKKIGLVSQYYVEAVLEGAGGWWWWVVVVECGFVSPLIKFLVPDWGEWGWKISVSRGSGATCRMFICSVAVAAYDTKLRLIFAFSCTPVRPNFWQIIRGACFTDTRKESFHVKISYIILKSLKFVQQTERFCFWNSVN